MTHRTFRSCPREAEIRILLDSGHWPHAVPAELRAHAAACRACGNQVLLTQAFRADRATASNIAQLPPPGILWWRAQLRRRNEAVERIGRPILGAHIFAFAITLVVAGGIVLSQIRFGFHWLADLVQSPAFNFSSLWSTSTAQSANADPLKWARLDLSLPYLIPVVVLLALLSGLVVFLATEKTER